MRVTLVSLMLVLLTSLGLAVENQAYLGLFAETSVMKIAGMPDMPDMPNMPNMPTNIMLPGKPNRMLNVRLWSPGIAADDAFAKLAPPAGLKLGPELALDLYRPQGDAGDPMKDFDPDKIPEFTIKFYWGSSETVKAGQPVIISWKDLSPAQKAAMREQARRAQQMQSYFYKPNWTTGYWPTGNGKGIVAKDASLVGTYALTTNYTGNVKLDVPKTVDFLAPIELTSPKLDAQLPMDKSMAFKWNPIPTNLGSYASVMGMIGQNTMIMWVSSEERAGMGESWDYLEMAQVRENVQKRFFMGPDVTAATVPAGIFKDSDFVMLRMVAYGPGAALDGTQPLPRLQTKSTLMGMLGGKKMAEMGGMGGGGRRGRGGF